MLASEETWRIRDAEYLNLRGAVHEARCEWKLARMFYGKAIAADRRYAPAQQNMRRLYELHTCGRSELHVALGDERPALAALLREMEHRTYLHDQPQH